MGNNNEELDDDICVTLQLDNDEQVECEILTIFPVGDQDYIALLPTTGEYADEGEVFLYRYVETPDGEPSLDNIMSDEEYDAVYDAFDEWLDASEFDEIVDEEEDAE